MTGGSVIGLSGELGSGKTCLAQGIAMGMGVPEELYVTSPSYVLINEYPGSIRLFHLDLYRINDVVQLDDIGVDEILGSSSSRIVNPRCRRYGRISPVLVSISIIDDQTRDFHLTASGQSAVDLLEKCVLELGA